MIMSTFSHITGQISSYLFKYIIYPLASFSSFIKSSRTGRKQSITLHFVIALAEWGSSEGIKAVMPA
ncbi:hypothetical protein ES708_21762 [subsurface metagenome]